MQSVKLSTVHRQPKRNLIFFKYFFRLSLAMHLRYQNSVVLTSEEDPAVVEIGAQAVPIIICSLCVGCTDVPCGSPGLMMICSKSRVISRLR